MTIASFMFNKSGNSCHASKVAPRKDRMYMGDCYWKLMAFGDWLRIGGEVVSIGWMILNSKWVTLASFSHAVDHDIALFIVQYFIVSLLKNWWCCSLSKSQKFVVYCFHSIITTYFSRPWGTYQLLDIAHILLNTIPCGPNIREHAICMVKLSSLQLHG